MKKTQFGSHSLTRKEQQQILGGKSCLLTFPNGSQQTIRNCDCRYAAYPDSATCKTISDDMFIIEIVANG